MTALVVRGALRGPGRRLHDVEVPRGPGLRFSGFNEAAAGADEGHRRSLQVRFMEGQQYLGMRGSHMSSESRGVLLHRLLRGPKRGVIVVLGQALNADGSAPRPLTLRAVAAARLWGTRHFPVMVTGGDAKGVGITEARLMQNELVKRGVPEEDIINEAQSTTTLENFWFMVRRLPVGTREVLVVTSDFHMPRAAYLCEAVLAHFRQKATSELLLANQQLQNLEDLKLEYHPVDSGCPQGGADADESGEEINLYPLTKRIQDEVRWISEEVPIALNYHVWGVAIDPLPAARLAKAKAEAEALLKEKGNCSGPA